MVRPLGSGFDGVFADGVYFNDVWVLDGRQDPRFLDQTLLYPHLRRSVRPMRLQRDETRERHMVRLEGNGAAIRSDLAQELIVSQLSLRHRHVPHAMIARIGVP